MMRAESEGLWAEALVGRVLRGKWRLDRMLGFGGMAVVYAGTHRNGMRGAVKLLRRELSEDEEARSRFLREGYVANRVDHPGIVRVLDDDVTEDGAVFLVMELLEGETVEARRAREPSGALAVAEVLGIADDLLDVLAAAHERGIVHRDLKPDNLFLTRQGQLKVLDFGIARLRELAASPVNATTRAGTLMGTPQFMPPEQAKGQWDRVDARTDLWAVGSTMFQLLSGRYVHEAETLPLLLLAAMTQPAPPMASVVPGLPPAIAGVLDVALAFDPDRRWPNARAMQHALRQARSGAAIELPPRVPSELGRPPVQAHTPASFPESARLSAQQVPGFFGDPARPPAPAHAPGSGPRGPAFGAMAMPGTASGAVLPERPAGAPRGAPRAATGALLAGAAVVALAVVGAVLVWLGSRTPADVDPSSASTVEAEPRPSAGAPGAPEPPVQATPTGVEPAASGAPVPAIAPSSPAPPIASAPASSTAAPASSPAPPSPPGPTARPVGGRPRGPAAPATAPAKAPPAPAPAEDPFNRRR
ncbi:protein kinase [Sorangium cellulosum]|uniref:Protein kinase n=1 Tax=Sorangium cellulosum TaxID=56 RepID=A0A2L0F1N4_SORCE|nr:serine/threonine-protein kinase [Sorangium cellulosum]AUX45443.1 protein kinase [Sorangium cellulosum]